MPCRPAALGLPAEAGGPLREALDEARRRAGLSRAAADAVADHGVTHTSLTRVLHARGEVRAG
ncbi:hypothetical protein [Streptomyces sp. NPDC088766]|uniref:hypothetical protein n=1 Tax=Streptomyces sp. NPDC088766 TaxID=3365893 RepID=UPI00382B5011